MGITGADKVVFEDEDLTIDDRYTKFPASVKLIIRKNDGVILGMFTDDLFNFMMTKLDEYFGSKRLRKNKYGDILVM